MEITTNLRYSISHLFKHFGIRVCQINVGKFRESDCDRGIHYNVSPLDTDCVQVQQAQ